MANHKMTIEWAFRLKAVLHAWVLLTLVRRWICSQEQLVAFFSCLACYLDRLSDHVQNLFSYRSAAFHDEPVHRALTVAIRRHEHWRNAAADAACGTIAMHLCVTGVHPSQITLAVYNLTDQCYGTNPLWRAGRPLGRWKNNNA